MSSKLLIVAALLVARVALFAQVPNNEILYLNKAVVEASEAYSFVFNFDEDLLHDHLSQIVSKRKIMDKICDHKLLKSKDVYISLGRHNPICHYRLEEPINSKRKKIFLRNSEEIFFSLNDKYLQLIGLQQFKDEIIYEVLTHSGGEAKINIEIHSTFYFHLINDKYVLVKADFNEIQAFNLKKL